MKNIDKIYNFLLLFFCFVLPLEHHAKAIPNIVLALLLLLFPFQNSKKSIKTIQKELVAILLFIGIIVFNTLIFSRWNDFNEIFRLSYIPLILLLFFPIRNIKSYLISFLSGAFLLLVLSSIQIGLKFVTKSDFEIVNGNEIDALLLGERPYLGFLYFMSACFLFYLGSESSRKIERIIYFILGTIFISFIFLIAARIMAISILASLVLAFFYFTKKIKWLFVTVLFLGGLWYGFSDNLVKRSSLKDEYGNVIITEPRYYIWKCAYEMIPNNYKEFIFGKGYAQTQNELKKCYQQKDDFLNADQKQWFIDSKFNTHNQFLDLWIGQGSIAFLLLLFFFLHLTLRNRHNFFSISLIISIFLFFLVENVLKRQIGCLLIAFALWFIFKQKTAKVES